MDTKKQTMIFVILTGVFIGILLFYNSKYNERGANQLTIYAYSSFTNPYGPMEEIKSRFKSQEGVDLNFVNVGEAGTIIQRVLLEGKKTKADLIMGLDQFSLDQAKGALKLHPIPQVFPPIGDSQLAEEIQKILDLYNITPYFIPYSWAPLALNYKKSSATQVQSFQDNLRDSDEFGSLSFLLRKEFKKQTILLDPRTSTPGYVLFDWFLQKLGENKTKIFFKNLDPYLIVPSWSTGYGLYVKGQAKFIFSQATSPIYHQVEEKNEGFLSLENEEGLPAQFEFISVLESSAKKDLAIKFIQFVLSAPIQRLIMTKNYMLPMTLGVMENSPFSRFQKTKIYIPSEKTPKEDVLGVWSEIKR